MNHELQKSTLLVSKLATVEKLILAVKGTKTIYLLKKSYKKHTLKKMLK